MSILQKLTPASTVGTCTEGERRIRRRASISHAVAPEADVATQHQRYAPDVQPSRRQVETEDLPSPSRKRPSWLGPVIAGMLVMVFMVWIGIAVVLPFVTDKINHWNTGEARVWQHDFNVGHGAGTSHFLTQYYQGHVLVIEVWSDHSAHAYVVPVQFVTPPRITPIITLQMQDVNGDQKPDLLVWVEGMASPIPLYNNGQTFQADDPTKKG